MTALILVSFLLPPSATADEHAHHRQALERGSATAQEQAAPITIPDVRVVDQDGQTYNFYTDLVKGKVVAINFMFTTCTTICPPLSATFSRIQTLTGDRSGKDFHLLTISVDPVTDSPPRMKAWMQRFKARPGWKFISGDRDEITRLLKALSASVSRKEDHTPLVLIGNDAAGKWTRAYGLAAAARLVTVIDEMIGTAATSAPAAHRH